MLRLFPNYRTTPIVALALAETKARAQNLEKDDRNVNQDVLLSFIKVWANDPSIPEW